MNTDKVTPVPIDFGESRNAQLWYNKEGNTLLVINFEDDDKDFQIDLRKYGIDEPKSITASSATVWENGIIKTYLKKHQSIFIRVSLF